MLLSISQDLPIPLSLLAVLQQVVGAIDDDQDPPYFRHSRYLQLIEDGLQLQIREYFPHDRKLLHSLQSFLKFGILLGVSGFGPRVSAPFAYGPVLSWLVAQN